MAAGVPLSAVWGSLVSGGFASGGVAYIDVNNQPAIDLANFYWDATNKRLSVGVSGDTTGTDSVNTYNQHDSYQLNSIIPSVNPWLSASTPGFTVSSSRGTVALNAASQTGDYLGQFGAWGYLPTISPAYTPLAAVFAYARGVDAAGNLGGELHFGTKLDSGIFTDWLTIDATGALRTTVAGVGSSGKTGFGWPNFFLQYTASPGTGNQTINTLTGRGSIAVGVGVATITNSKVTVTSVVLVQLESNDATATRLIVTVANGSFVVTANANTTAQTNFSFVVLNN